MRPPFAWLIPRVLCGGPHPLASGGLRGLAPTLRAEGIGAILSVYELPLDEDEIGAYGLRYLWQRTSDWAPPPDLAAACAFIDEARQAGMGTLVHCLAGVGRTGTVLGAYLLHTGMCGSAAEARHRVRTEYDERAIESREQFSALEDFATIILASR
jgi:atypical dual specificity phosphatase